MTRLDAERTIARELEPNERLVWSGAPRQGLALRPADMMLIPFSLLWGGFAIFWEAGVLRAGAPMPFPLFGIPFVVIGLYLIFGRFFVDANIRANTAYGLTDRRVIIVSGLVNRSVKSLQLKTISDVTLAEQSDGMGTITFGPSLPMARWTAGAAWPGASNYAPPAFDMISRARDVYSSIRDAQGGR